MPDAREPEDPAEPLRIETAAEDIDSETVPAAVADVESAGRSCMVILVIAAVILLLLCVWIGFRSTGVGR